MKEHMMIKRARCTLLRSAFEGVLQLGAAADEQHDLHSTCNRIGDFCEPTFGKLARSDNLLERAAERCWVHAFVECAFAEQEHAM